MTFIAVWDETIPKFERRLLDEHQIEIIDREDAWDEANDGALDGMDRDLQPLRRAAERVHMLGPDAVEGALDAMFGTIRDLALGISSQYVRSAEEAEPLEVYWRAMGEIVPCRRAFLDATRKALRQAPNTKPY
ncbi:hypothetical protein ACFYN3_35585 [Streptomyces lavendulae]|uniref:hypothetical protein n=1 Tax=Streptomyces lavendulae TaxID=1914 RepID=UPI0033EE60F2